MAPFCMNITENISGGGYTPFNNNSFRYYNMHNLEVCKKKSHGKSCPGPGTLLNEHSDPPPLSLSLGGGGVVSGFFFFFCFFKILLRIKINSLALVYLKINFLVELMLKINNLSRQNFPALPSLRIKWSPP